MDLDPTRGSETSKTRPTVVISTGADILAELSAAIALLVEYQ